MGLLKILYINGGSIDHGGISSYMINYYKNFDKNKIQIDFIVHGMKNGSREDFIRNMGSQVYHIPTKRENIWKNYYDIKSILNSGRYSIVHSHLDGMNGIVLRQAKECGVPVRISHSHNTQHLTKNKLQLFLHEYVRKEIPRYATHLFACSEAAGKWLYGADNFSKGIVKVIKNAINLREYYFNENIRSSLRKSLKLNGKFVIGHVGRFEDQKNHAFLLEIFSKVLKLNPEARLVLIGDGNCRKQIEKKIQELKVEGKVKLLGQRDDVNLLLNLFDVFILPSKFEGLPVVAIEAQANGLKCILSNRIPEEVAVGDYCIFLSLETTSQEWAKQVLVHGMDGKSRNINESEFIDSGYDIQVESKKLQDFYLNV